MNEPGAMRDASVVVARDVNGLVALLSADFPRHGGEYLFLPGGRREEGENPEECARRELREEAGITAETWQPLGAYAMTLGSTARVHLFEAANLTLGPQELTPNEADFKLAWWPLNDAITAAAEGRFLLPAGPLALLLVDRREIHVKDPSRRAPGQDSGSDRSAKRPGITVDLGDY
ncbi:NUDIX hydrolase [Streptomyces sp. NPDC004647]|uniref:NUDIX hydrolase n=1 Tax=Streptomyces sp. NPDC004647 TaxID=3154671 RepID=UPI0033A53E94